MNVCKGTRLFVSLAVGTLLAMGLTVALVTAQGSDQDDAPPAPAELPGEVRQRLASSAGSSGSELGGRGVGVTADVRPPGSFDIVLFSEDFEWSGARWDTDGLWHPVRDYLDDSDPYSRTHSPHYAMWYGQDLTGNYSTGGRAAGSITTRHLISIPTSAVSVTLSFWSWEETELAGAAGNWDRRELYISGTLTTTWELLWSTQFTPTVEQQWHQVVADVSDYRGQGVHLRFAFDSVDHNYNDHEGWYLDDIALVVHAVPVLGYDLTDAWVQAFFEDHPDPTDLEIHVDRVEAGGVTPWQMTDDGDGQFDAAVPAHPVRDIPVVWVHSYTNTHGVRVGDVEYAALDPDGATRVPLTKVTDNSGVTFPPVWDYGPAVGVNPADGSTVIAWTHCLSCPVSLLTRVYNVYYAIRDVSGRVVTGPAPLTDNTSNSVRDWDPAVETFPDGNILIAWRHDDYDTSSWNIFYTVLDRSGSPITDTHKPETPGRSFAIRLARLGDGNILTVWQDLAADRDIFYAVVDSNGDIVKRGTNLTNYSGSGLEGRYPEAVGLANGNSVIAWTEIADDDAAAQIKYAVLDSAYNVHKSPAVLPNPYNAASNGAVSMVADEADAVVLTWSDFREPRTHIYYSQLDNNGNLLVGPTIYRQTRGSAIHSSSRGYGIGGLPPDRVYLPLVVRNFS